MDQNLKLEHINALITGASEGLGKAIAKAYVLEGASISICARNQTKLNDTLKELEALKLKPSQKVIGFVTDVSDRLSCETFVKESVKQLGSIQCLINNAGILGEVNPIEADHLDLKHWIETIEINLFGVLYMSHAVIPYLKQNKHSSVLNLSGGGATSPMPGLSAYAASKAAVVRLTETLALELEPYGISVNAIAPGAMNTKFLEDLLNEGKSKVSEAYFQKALEQKTSGGTDPSLAAQLCVYLTSEGQNITGKLISAVWDDWKNLHHHIEDLKSDIYTLRRIIPKDRNKDF